MEILWLGMEGENGKSCPSFYITHVHVSSSSPGVLWTEEVENSKRWKTCDQISYTWIWIYYSFTISILPSPTFPVLTISMVVPEVSSFSSYFPKYCYDCTWCLSLHLFLFTTSLHTHTENTNTCCYNTSQLFSFWSLKSLNCKRKCKREKSLGRKKRKRMLTLSYMKKTSGHAYRRKQTTERKCTGYNQVNSVDNCYGTLSDNGKV